MGDDTNGGRTGATNTSPDTSRDSYVDTFELSGDGSEAVSGATEMLRLIAASPEQSVVESVAPEPEFTGNERYAVEARLGSGAFGDVYRVFDRERGVPVALKRLRRPEAHWLLRFKEEFRALAGVVHENLVTLYDLHAEGRSAYFTMELVEGVDFLTYVRMAGEAEARIARLRDVLRQLVSGVAYLHAAGKVHRDLKPSNVMVTHSGRVVVLDFGLIADAGRDDGGRAQIVGTPAYMAPEQAVGALATPAADWYAVGVMLYEALTGVLPYGGSSQEIIASKRRSAPALARLVAPDAPADLEALCARLLQREPIDRPDLAKSEWAARPRRHSSGVSDGPARVDAYVGRSGEREALDLVFERALGGRCAWAMVHGASGMGKSALVDAWLHDVRARHPDVVVLSGRCYEREAVPYKALDGVVDALAKHLGALPRSRAAALWPSRGTSLAALFPVLGAHEPPGASERSQGDPRQRFSSAAGALRALLTNLRAERPVIVAVDDLQWGDMDSVELLSELVGFAGAPALCIVTCHRREEAESSAILAEAFALSRRAVEMDCLDVAVDALSQEDGRRMVAARLGEVDAGAVDAMLRDARGSPYLLDELCRSHGRVVEGPPRGAPSPPRPTDTARSSLDAILVARAAELPEAARCLLELVALAGRPLQANVAYDAMRSGAPAPKVVLLLRAERLVRSRTQDAVEWLECYHDRVREAVLATIAEPMRPPLHQRLAHALIAANAPDVEAIGRHLFRAGELAPASGYFERAADLAAGALAFERAARLYRQALECLPELRGDARLPLLRRLAEALANGGFGAESAAVYSEIATLVPRTEVALVRRDVAEQLWRGGRIAEGREVAKAVVRSLGFGWTDSRLGTLLRTVFQRARLWFRMRRQRDPITPEANADPSSVLDAGYFFGNYLSGIEPLRGIQLHTEALVRAFAAGDGARVGRGLTIEAFIRCWREGDPERTDGLLARAEELTRDASPGIRAQALCGRAAALCARTDFPRFLDAATEAERLFLTQCQTGYRSEATLARWMRHTGLFYTGAWRPLCLDYEHFRRDCEQRGDALFLYVGEAHFGWLASMLADDAPGMFAAVSRVAEYERRVGYLLAHSSPRMVDALARRYSGDGEGALLALRTLWPALVKQGVRFIASAELRFRVDHAASALTALAGERRPRVRKAMETAVARDIRRILTLPIRVAEPLAGLLRAGLLATRGHIELALRLAERAERACRTLSLPQYAAALRRQRGLCIGGAQGEALVREADTLLRGVGASNPARLADFLVPGFARR